MLAFHSPPRKLRLALLAMSFAWAFLLPNLVRADIELESKLKAAYLINIASFVRWPGEKPKVNFCIGSDSPVYSYIKAHDNYDIGRGTQLFILENPNDLAHCDMLYWDEQSTFSKSTNLFETAHPALLMISDNKGALREGFAIQFFVRNLKLRFAVNQALVKASDYKISSKLLRLSRQVD